MVFCGSSPSGRRDPPQNSASRGCLQCRGPGHEEQRHQNAGFFHFKLGAAGEGEGRTIVLLPLQLSFSAMWPSRLTVPKLFPSNLPPNHQPCLKDEIMSRTKSNTSQCNSAITHGSCLVNLVVMVQITGRSWYTPVGCASLASQPACLPTR